MVTSIVEKDVNCRHGRVLGFQLFQHLPRCLGIDLLTIHKGELKGLKIKCALNVQPLASGCGFNGDFLVLGKPTMSRAALMLRMHCV